MAGEAQLVPDFVTGLAQLVPDFGGTPPVGLKKIYIGGVQVQSVYKGSTPVPEVYAGSVKVFG
jgi:hypothetical protein